MRLPPKRLLAVLLFAALSLLALASSGLLDWIASSLFLVLEFLAGFLRRVFGLRIPGRPLLARPRARPAPTLVDVRNPSAAATGAPQGGHGPKTAGNP